MKYHGDGVDEGSRGFGVDLLEEFLVFLEGGESVEQIVQHLRHVATQRGVQGHAALRQLPHVLHHALVAKVVRKRLHPLRQQLHHVRAKATQLLLQTQNKTMYIPLSSAHFRY